MHRIHTTKKVTQEAVTQGASHSWFDVESRRHHMPQTLLSGTGPGTRLEIAKKTWLLGFYVTWFLRVTEQRFNFVLKKRARFLILYRFSILVWFILSFFFLLFFFYKVLEDTLTMKGALENHILYTANHR